MYTNEEIQEIKDIVELRSVANELGVSFSGNTGIDTLRSKILDEINKPKLQDETIQIAKLPVKLSVEQLLKMDASNESDPNIRREIIRAKAMKLIRVTITNLDPSDSALTGANVTVTNKYIGKVTKHIPFGEGTSEGYHIPQIILDFLKIKKYAIRKEIKGNKVGVKQYKTVMAPKYAITVLPPLTEIELKELAQRQAATNYAE